MTTIKNITDYLEGIAPLSYQESYDNSGLITGEFGMEVTGILISLDCTEDVVIDAIKNKCNMVVCHHPIIFSGLKKINGKNYIEKTIITAIKNDIAIYAIHTNLDNVIKGVNGKIAEILGLTNLRILSLKNNVLEKLVVFCPVEHAEKVRSAMFNAGAGDIGNYNECSFNILGEGTYKGNEQSNPFKGKPGQRHVENEIRIEVVLESFRRKRILMAMQESHPYEEVAYDVYSLQNNYGSIGSGIIGELSDNQEETIFLNKVKQVMEVKYLRHTLLLNKPVKRVAVCGGSGSFLLNDAIKEGADVFITADFKYHQFFDANKRIVIADIGHFESEQFTMELIQKLILEKFSTFAVRLTEVNTNPVFYF